MSAYVRPSTEMTVEEFMAWDPGDGVAWQLVDGEPQAMAPTKRTHGAIQGELGALIRNHLREKGGPCSLVVAPGVIPRVAAKHNVRIPDLAVTCSPYAEEESALTDPVLLVEIMSPSNVAETWANVWAYTSIPSVIEILLVRSHRIAAEILRRLPDGSWPAEPQALVGGDLVLESIGFRTPLAGLYRTTRLAATASPG